MLLVATLVDGQFVFFPAVLSSLQPPPSMTVLALVNPFSGPGKALHIFQQRIVPVLAEAGIKFQMKITGILLSSISME